MKTHKWLLALLVSFVALSSIGCSGLTQIIASKQPLDESDITRVSMTVASSTGITLPEGTRIVVGEVEGACGQEVKDALMLRLIDNPHYDVLSRDNLPEVLQEIDFSWSGQVDSQTASELGKILGASVYIVGRVSFCGVSSSSSPDNKMESQLNISAMLQIIDLPTGRLIFSSASEGTYVPRLIYPPSSPPISNADLKRWEFWKKSWRWIKRFFQAYLKEPIISEPLDYTKVKAAEEAANSFADKLFGRPTWETLEMWKNPRWKYDDSVQFVKLGYCAEAIEFLENDAAQQLPRMREPDVSKYLHNYGVALLCNNQPQLAMEKLRASYQIGYNQTTLRMLGLAAQIDEWSLEVEVNTGPEVELLYHRLEESIKRWQLLDLELPRISGHP